MDEKEALRKMIERKLEEKGHIVVDAEISDEKMVSALLDVCTLNQLRDTLERNK